MLFSQWLHCFASRLSAASHRRFAGRRGWLPTATQVAGWSITPRRDIAGDVGNRIERFEDRALLVAGTFAFSVASSTASEATATRTVVVHLTTDAALASGESMTIDVILGAGSTATGGGVDYTFASTTLTFTNADVTAAGTFTKSVTVTVFDDRSLEGSESVFLDLDNPLAIGGANTAVEGSPGTHEVAITDNETGVINFQADQSNAESVAPTVMATLTITGTGSGGFTLANNLTVTASDAGGGSAMSGVDYTSFGTPILTFTAGAGASINSSTATIDVSDDQRLEGDETVNLSIGSLSSSLNGTVTLSDTTHTATIIDNETGVINFLADAATAESVDPTQNATLAITGVGTGTVGLDVALTVAAIQTGGTATSGTDYAAYGTQTLTFSAGDGTTITSSNATLDVTSDQRLEGDETVGLSIGGLSSNLDGQVTLSDTTHTATITDDETGVINFLADAATAESVDPTQNATLAITGVGTGTVGLDVALTVAATQTGGTAISGTDYAAYGSQTLTFSTGNGTTITSSNATLNVTSDQRLEGDETVGLSIGSLSNDLSGQVTLSDTTHAATITDDETGVINFLADAASAESVDPTQNATLAITGVGTGTVGLDVALTVAATQTGGTATSGTDYAAYGSQTLTFSVGNGATITSSNATLDVTSDQRLEGDETVNLSIGSLSSDLSGQVTLSDTTHTATITDDETGVINFLANAAAAESVDPTQNATLAISGVGTGTVGLDVALTVSATRTGGSATSGTDFAAYGSQTLTFSVGDGTTITSSNATLDVTSDQRLEGDETVNLSIGSLSSTLSGQVSLSDTTHTATITDDETGVINFLADAAAAESVDPTQNATLTITGIGTGTVGLNVALTVSATQTGGTATSGTDYAAYGSQTLTFSVGDGTTITSSNATLNVTDDQRLEGDQTVGLTIGSLSSTLSGQVSLSDTTHTATIEDNEIGVINFQADQNNAESVDPTIRAILTITPIGTGTVALEPSLTVVASEAGGGTAIQNVDYAAFGPATLTFSANATADGSNQIDSSTATLNVVQDRRTDENPETVHFGLGTLSSTLDGQTSLSDITHTATITDDDSITIAGAATVNEASPYNVVVTVNLSPTPDATTDITVNWDDGTPSTTFTPLSNGSFTIPHVYTDGMPTVENITVDLTEDPVELAGGDITYTNQANAFSVTVLNVAPTLDVLYGPVTYTGTQLNSLINTGVASAPSGTRVLTGSRLDFTGTVGTGILFQLPLISAGRLMNGDSVEFTMTTNWDNLSADADLGFTITDGTNVVGGNFGQTSAANSFFWLEQGTHAGNRVNPVSYPNVANIARSMPFTVVVSVSATGVTVRGTNNLGTTFLYNTTATLNLANALSMAITSDNVGESYGINTLFVQAVGSAGIFTNSGPINEGSSGTVFFSRTPFDPSPEDRAAPLKYSYDFDNDGTWDVGDGTYAGGVLTSSVSVPATFNDGTVTRAVRGRVIDKDFAFDDDGDTVVNTDGNQTADPGESNDNFSDYVTNVVINNVAPTIALTGDASLNEGSVYTLNLGAITDPGQDTVTAYSINWGDGTTDNFVGSPVSTMATHTFADGSTTPTITVSLTDEDGTFVGGTKTITVNNVAPTIALSGAASVNEGSTYTLTLGAITDPGTDTVGFYAVNWGDGAVTAAFAHPTGLMLTHVYSDGPANRTITVTLSDEDATHLNTGSLMVTVNNVDPTIALIGNSSVVQGSIYTLTLGTTAIDPGQDTVSAYSINWGDGSAIENFTGLPNNAVKTHLYPNTVASYTITVSLTDEDGTYAAAGTKMVSVTAVPDPTITLNGAATTNEGSVYTLSMGAVANPGTITSYSINWGDGVTENFSGSPANTNKTHTYADGAAAGTPRTITVSITNGSGTFSAGTLGITVNNVAPTIALTGTGTATTGVAYSLNLGAVTDPGMDTITGYSINWGDGSAVENFVGSPVGQTKMHTYASAGGFTITVSLTDEDGTFTGGTSMVTVTAAAPAVALTGNATTDEGAVYTLNLGAVTNGGTITAHSINWGDGTIDNFSGSPASTMQTHTYADGSAAGTPRTISVSITNGSGTFAAGTLGVTVNNVAPTIVVTGAASVNEGSTYTVTLGAITDPGTDTVGFYAVNWGDGAVTSAFAHPTGLMLTHVYSDGPASRTITVTLSDEDATHLNTGSLMVMVNNVAPTIALIGNASVVQGEIYTLTLGTTAIDPGQDIVSAYSIDWGDGSAVENFTGLPNNAVKTHTYASLGSFTIIVTLTDEDGTVTGGTKMVSVTAAPAPTIALTGAATTNEGSVYTLSLGAVTNPGTITAYSIDWGDGVTDNFSGSPANTSKTHTYADGVAAGTPRTITVSVTNGSGTFTAGTLGVTVNNVTPTIALTGTGTGTVGVAYSLNLGAITDPGTDTITGYSINWGDGSSVENFSGSPTGQTKMHTYASAAAFTVTVSLTDEDGTFTGGTHAVTIGAAAAPPVGFGPTTYTGTDLNGLIGSGGATAPTGTRVLTGSRLDITGTKTDAIVFQLPLFTAGTFTAADSVTFTTTVDWTMLTADNDFGIGITDGVKVVAGQEADNGKFYLEQANFEAGNNSLASVAYPANASVARTMPFTVTITVTPSGVKVRGTNAAGVTFQHNSTSTINLANALSVVLLSNTPGEKYGINTMTVQAVKAGATLSGGELLVNGTGTNDTLLVRKSGDGTQVIVESTYNGGATTSASFAIGSVTSVRMNLGTGDDKGFVRNNGTPWAMPSTVNGDDGNDLIVTAEGNDTINGGRGKDFIIAGTGADAINGGAGEDALIGGSTSHDSNTAALTAFMTEWTSANSYATRLTNLLNGTGATGGNKLIGSDGATQTLFADTDVDTLTGGADTDAFWANLVVDNGGALDIITDLVGGETTFDTDL